MDGKTRLADYVRWYVGRYGEAQPIYEIMLFEHPCKELMFMRDGVQVPSGYPDAGMNSMGFYYELDTAIEAMHENWCDIHETVFGAGFILCKFPGLYDAAGPEARIFFAWDEERQGFYEDFEPDIFQHYAY